MCLPACRFEGVWGTLLVGCLMLPLAQVAPGPEGCGLHEDTRETLAMLAGSPQLRAACLATVAVMGCYNIAGAPQRAGSGHRQTTYPNKRTKERLSFQLSRLPRADELLAQAC